MPHGTARAPHVRLSGQFTTHTARAVKKIDFFFGPFSSLFPLSTARGPLSPKLFFFLLFLRKKMIPSVPKNEKCHLQVAGRSPEL
jgi:hypothetical protein